MRITLIFPAVGHKTGEAYIRSWQMEPLPIAAIAGLTPKEVEVKFYDDRLEAIPFDEPTDAVAISVETYTAMRAYQIASEYRKRNIPVILGGFHVTLIPEEAARFGDAIIIGEAEAVWANVIDDLRHGTLQVRYHGIQTDLSHICIDRSIFKGRKYLPLGLIETGRGCRFPCEFCAVQSFFKRTYRRREPDAILQEIAELKSQKNLFFFVDDNFAGNLKESGDWLPELGKLNIRWVTQMSINAAHDEDFVAKLATSGCRAVLIGFESLDEENLKQMNKRFNTMKGGFSGALAILRRYGISVYGTFVFGYDKDTKSSFDEAIAFARQEKMYLAAFNHLLPFPGTPFYERLHREGRLRYPNWWLEPTYRYNDVSFYPRLLSPEELTQNCLAARQEFYQWGSILKRFKANSNDFFMMRNFIPLNLLHRHEAVARNGYPLGDESWQGSLIEVG